MMLGSLTRITAVAIAAAVVPTPTEAQQPPHPTAAVQDKFIEWPLPASAAQYRDIDGHRIYQYVVEQSQISRRYRDAGHPKFWGRIIGTSADAESAQWLSGNFKRIGLSDVRVQSFDLAPQWFPKDFRVTVRSGARIIDLPTAQPDYRAVATPASGLDLEAVYVGMGRESDYIGRDVRGKAVFVYSMLGMPDIWEQDKTKRALAKGAAAIFNVHMLPGAMRYQEYPMPANVPSFSVGGDDGFELEKMIAAGQPVRVSVRLDTEMVPNLKTALVWGTLPGASDETVYIIAHRDGWFDAAGDNAGGVASMIGLAEHFAKIPQAQRPRTIVFIGLDGHHNSGDGSAVGGRWLFDNRKTLFAKTALMINAEHPSTVLTMVRPRYTDLSGGAPEMMYWTTGYTPQQWYAGGPSRPVLQEIAVGAFREFGVTTYIDPLPRPPAGDLGRHFRYVPGVATSDFHDYFHTDLETPETVPWTGLEATTRAYARIIDEVNKRPLGVFQRPEEPAP